MSYPKKSLGQNFLIDKNIIGKILNLFTVKSRDIIEIGPGHGSLTDEIIKLKPKSLCMIEKDIFLSKKLKQKYKNYKEVKIYNKDILHFPLEKILKKNSVIIGNLPYNISSQILVKILRFKKYPPKFSDVIFMFQKELGEKIISKFPSKKYGRISILTNLKLEEKKNFLISPNCFFPKPKIYSMIIHFKPKSKILYNIKNIENLEKITNLIFANKRKMINKILKKIFNDDRRINKLKINTKLRPGDIKPDIYYKITEIYEAM